MSALDLELPAMSMDTAALAQLLRTRDIDVVENCLGALIAFRCTAAFTLVAGTVTSLGYMVGAAILTPDLGIEPLGALVKTGPAIILI